MSRCAWMALREEGRGEDAYSIVDVFAAGAADVFPKGGELGRAAEEDEGLVEGVCGEVVDEAVHAQILALPSVYNILAYKLRFQMALPEVIHDRFM